MAERLFINQSASSRRLINQLSEHFVGPDGQLQLVRASSAAPGHYVSAVGAELMDLAVREVSSHKKPYTLLSLGIRDSLGQAGEMREVNTLSDVFLDVMRDLPQFEQARENDPLLAALTIPQLLDVHFDVVRILNNMSSSPKAFRDTLKRSGIAVDPDQFLEDFCTPQRIRAAAFVDAAVATWIHKYMEESSYAIVERDDWDAHSIRKGFYGQPFKSDIGINQSSVPSLATILAMSPKVRDYQIELYTTMGLLNDVVVLHTEKDRRNLEDIIDYGRRSNLILGFYRKEGETIVVRNLMPTGYEAMQPREYDPGNAASFISRAVNEQKIIVGETGKLDFFKRNLVFLDHLLYGIRSLSEEYRDLLDNVRVAVVARPKKFPDQSTSDVKEWYEQYEAAYEAKLNEVNEEFKGRMGTEEDFVLVHRDSSGRLSGMPQDQLRSTVLPYVDIAIGIGEEGLNLATQEANIERVFGWEEPQPSLSIVASDTGFAEKAAKHRLDHVNVMNNPEDSEKFMQTLIRAVSQIEQLRKSPMSPKAQDMRRRIKDYYEKVCSDGFHLEVLDALIGRKLAGKNV